MSHSAHDPFPLETPCPQGPETIHSAVFQPTPFPMTCPSCGGVTGVARKAKVGRRHGAIVVLVHCTGCLDEWQVELPKADRSIW